MNFTHLSERDKFYYIHNKFENQFFDQVQTWVKTIKQRETFSVQGFFDQLILVYDNYVFIKIITKNLNKMKQGYKNPFSTFISRLGKKMSKTGEMDWNYQIMKTFFKNVLNNAMYKSFIGYFVPAMYIVYCTMFHGINNPFKTLRLKNVRTTTVIKVTTNTKSFTTVNSTATNDEMDWEFTNVTSSATKTAKKPTEKRKTKWVFSAIIKKRFVFVVEFLATG